MGWCHRKVDEESRLFLRLLLSLEVNGEREKERSEMRGEEATAAGRWGKGLVAGDRKMKGEGEKSEVGAGAGARKEKGKRKKKKKKRKKKKKNKRKERKNLGLLDYSGSIRTGLV
ncbi:hypothetical protein JCGZ_19370 [Jatropha curcas]|uniref:Uncharacterized protein n=1 Tax=Jatropha curcas TaxID=180498 RepID=A0A067K9H3_JATCU|nr:hypothetical protein JCGZ_19370 [Jatropha curcas]